MRARALVVASLVFAVVMSGCTTPFRPPEPALYTHEVVAGDLFTQLVVEIDHAPGREPSQAAIDHLLASLGPLLAKQRIDVIVTLQLDDTPDKVWTLDEMVALEVATRNTAHVAPTAVIHVLYVAGRSENQDALGVTVSGPPVRPIVIFVDQMDKIGVALIEGTPPLAVPQTDGGRETVERVVLLHEAGHAIGLVNNGLPMVNNHEAADSEGHSANPESIMTPSVNSLNATIEAFGAGKRVPDSFDGDDLADVRVVSGK